MKKIQLITVKKKIEFDLFSLDREMQRNNRF